MLQVLTYHVFTYFPCILLVLIIIFWNFYDDMDVLQITHGY